MARNPVTLGELVALLEELDFYPKPLDDHWLVHFERNGDAQFVLPNGPPEAPAREKDLAHVRFQLHWRGLMEQEDFDARFGTHRTRATR